MDDKIELAIKDCYANADGVNDKLFSTLTEDQRSARLYMILRACSEQHPTVQESDLLVIIKWIDNLLIGAGMAGLVLSGKMALTLPKEITDEDQFDKEVKFSIFGINQMN